MRAAIREYVRSVVEDEWPRMALQQRSAQTDAALNALLRNVAQPGNASDFGVQRTMLEMALTIRAAHPRVYFLPWNS